MTVRDMMTSPVHTIGPDAPAWEAVALMRSHRIRRVPVVEDTRLVGIVTWTDVVRIRPPAIGGRWTASAFAAGVLVRHLMTPDPVTVTLNTPIETAAALMRRRKVGGLPVVEDGRLLGIVTESDLFEMFVEFFGASPEEVHLRVPVMNVAVELPRVVAELVRAGVPIISLLTLRLPGASAIDIVVRDVDEIRAREILGGFTRPHDGDQPLALSRER